MAKIPTGDKASEFNLRPGVAPLTDAGWAGVNTEDDPSSLLANELQRGQNLRRQGKTLRSRPGLVQKIDLSTVAGFPAGSVMWMKEAPIICTPLNVWASTLGIYGGDVPTGASISQLESTAVPISHVHVTFTATADRQIPLATYGSKTIIGDGTVLRELLRILVFPDSDATRIPTAPTVPLAQVPVDCKIRCLLEFNGKLFVGVENTTDPTTSKIMVWDGRELKDDLTAIRPPLAFGIWRNKLVAGFDATAAHIRVRATGAVPGTWVTVALAGSLCATQGNAMCEVRQYLYMASGTNKIFRFDGSALVLIRTIAGCAVDGNGCTSLTLHNGLLYYGWNTDPNYYATLGRHDPDSTATEWIDTYKALATDQPDFKRVSSLASYRGQIYCGGQQGWIVATFPNHVQGTIEAIVDNGASSPGYEVVQLLRS